MCTGLELIMLAGTAVSVVGAVKQGQDAKEMAGMQIEQATTETGQRLDAARAQADKIRKAGRAQVSSANAALAGSGVKLGEGTPLEIQKNITQAAEEDALTAILNGKRVGSSAEREARLLARSGRNAMSNAYYSAGSTVLSAGGQYAKGDWKSAAQTGGAE